jgi:hypothetical protein
MTKLKETKLDDQIEIILKFVGPRGKFVQGIVLQVVKCEMMNGFNTFGPPPFFNTFTNVNNEMASIFNLFPKSRVFSFLGLSHKIQCRV